MKKVNRSDLIRFPLDTAANVYPTAKRTSWNNTFSVSIVLSENIQPDVLCICVSEMRERLPGFFVSLRIAYNRCVFVPSTDNDIVSEETGAPLDYIDFHNPDKPIFRIKYKENRITAEVFHALADGTGAMMFLRSLAARYIEHTHGIIIDSPLIHSVRDSARAEEFEDAYRKYLLSDKKRLKKIKDKGGLFASANEEYYHIDGVPSPEFGRIVRIVMNTDELKKAAAKYNETISEFLTAVSSLSLYRLDADRTHLPQRIAVPAGMRRYYPTPTLRNFSTVTNIIIRLKSDKAPDLNAVAKSLGNQLRDAAERDSLASSFVKVALLNELFIVRALPFALLSRIIAFGKRIGGDCSTCFSNIGVVKFPEEMLPYVERAELALSRQGRGGTMFAAAGYNGICTVSATLGSDDESILNAFLKILEEENINYTRR